MPLQLPSTTPSAEVWDGNENASDASWASAMSFGIPRDLPSSRVGLWKESVWRFDDDSNGAYAEFLVDSLHLITEAPTLLEYWSIMTMTEYDFRRVESAYPFEFSFQISLHASCFDLF